MAGVVQSQGLLEVCHHDMLQSTDGHMAACGRISHRSLGMDQSGICSHVGNDQPMSEKHLDSRSIVMDLAGDFTADCIKSRIHQHF